MKTLQYLIITCLVLLGFNCSAQIDTCDAQIHAVSDTPCSRRILHLAVEADTLPNTTYTWEAPDGWTASGDSVTRDSILYTQIGDYIVTGIRGVCTYTDTVSVFIKPTPPVPSMIYNNSPVCVGDTLIVRAVGPGFEIFTFYLDPGGDHLLSPHYDSLILPNTQINMGGQYAVYITSISVCCSDTLHFDVEVDSCALIVSDVNNDKPFIPTLLQSSEPIFKPIFKPSNETYKMQVLDINGKKVFETDNGNGWDRSAYQGIYFYMITTKTQGYSKVYKGKLTLL